jgi:hypothetical protein
MVVPLVYGVCNDTQIVAAGDKYSFLISDWNFLHIYSSSGILEMKKLVIAYQSYLQGTTVNALLNTFYTSNVYQGMLYSAFRKSRCACKRCWKCLKEP